VFLAEPPETPYDLRWRMFGVHIRVHPFFWVLGLLLGWSAYTGGNLGFLAVWMACFFVSILLHEFGHVLMGRLFGSDGYIILYSFGGLAVGSNRLARRWQRILVLLAGPGIQLLLFAALLGLGFLPPDSGPGSWGPYAKRAFSYLFVINLYWPILNLLPVFPLDGGQISRELCEAVSPQRGVAFSLGLSMVVAGFLAVHCLVATPETALLPWLPTRDYFLAMMFALLAVTSFQALQMENARQRQWERADDYLPWER
jgi:Zn-dependent protease